MKRFCISILLAVLLLSGCVSSGKSAVSGVVSLDEALAAAVTTVSSRVETGTEIVIAKIEAPLSGVSDFLSDELTGYLSDGGAFTVLERGRALQAVDDEHQFQMSGMVSDESAVGIGHYLGAKVVITGTFSRYADFSQLSFRFIDVRSSQVLATYRARVRPDDAVLRNVMGADTTPAPKVSENALDHLNRGKDFYAEGKFDEAIAELDRAIAMDNNLAEVYFYRANAYRNKNDMDKAIADYTQEIRINPNDAYTYNNRGNAYQSKNDYDRAITDYTQAIRINPNDAYAYNNRGAAYQSKNDYDRAITDYTQAIRINPNHASAYYNRGNAYYYKKDIDKAIADYTQAIQINPNYANAYFNRANAYYDKKDLDRSIADYEAALRINPNFANARQYLEETRQERGR